MKSKGVSGGTFSAGERLKLQNTRKTPREKKKSEDLVVIRDVVEARAYTTYCCVSFACNHDFTNYESSKNPFQIGPTTMASTINETKHLFSARKAYFIFSKADVCVMPVVFPSFCVPMSHRLTTYIEPIVTIPGSED